MKKTAIVTGSSRGIGFAIARQAALGLDVPGDLSVTGLTDIQLAHQFRPALTTVAVSTSEAARLSVEMLLKVIKDGAEAPVDVWAAATPQLVVRDSTGAPRDAAA